jgi:hypothetical protein
MKKLKPRMPGSKKKRTAKKAKKAVGYTQTEITSR